MTPDRLTELLAAAEAAEKRANAATAGPYEVYDLGINHFVETNHRYGIGSNNSSCYAVAKVEGDGECYKDTAAFLAAARTDVPTLIAGLRELAAEVERKELERSTAMGLLMQVYEQAGNSAPAERRHALTPGLRDQIRDLIFMKPTEQP